jgi:hypothetical protein
MRRAGENGTFDLSVRPASRVNAYRVSNLATSQEAFGP